MGNQRRDDIDTGTRDDRTISQNSSGNVPLSEGRVAPENQGSFAHTVTQPGGWYERGREDLRRRSTDRREDYGTYNRSGYTASGPQGGNIAAPTANYTAEAQPSSEANAYRGREYDSYAQPARRAEDFAFVPTQPQAYYPPTMQRTGNTRPFGTGPIYESEFRGRATDRDDDVIAREQRVGSRTSHDRDAQAYGDYGHPGGGRSAYGDMGASERATTGGFVQRAGAGLTDRVRRWRKGPSSAHDVMTRNPKCVKPSDTLQHVAQIMIDEDTGIVPVVEDGNRLIGVITDRDIVCRLIARGVDHRTAKAADAMTNDVECVTEEHSLHDILDIMSTKQVRRVPVVAKGDRLVGIISMSDVAREADVDEDLQDTFEDISSRRGFWSRLR